MYPCHESKNNFASSSLHALISFRTRALICGSLGHIYYQKGCITALNLINILRMWIDNNFSYNVWCWWFCCIQPWLLARACYSHPLAVVVFQFCVITIIAFSVNYPRVHIYHQWITVRSHLVPSVDFPASDHQRVNPVFLLLSLTFISRHGPLLDFSMISMRRRRRKILFKPKVHLRDDERTSLLLTTNK